VTFGLASALHEDNRYFNSGKKGLWPRTWSAVTSGILARHDDASATSLFLNWAAWRRVPFSLVFGSLRVSTARGTERSASESPCRAKWGLGWPRNCFLIWVGRLPRSAPNTKPEPTEASIAENRDLPSLQHHSRVIRKTTRPQTRSNGMPAPHCSGFGWLSRFAPFSIGSGCHILGEGIRKRPGERRKLTSVYRINRSRSGLDTP